MNYCDVIGSVPENTPVAWKIIQSLNICFKIMGLLRENAGNTVTW